MLKRFVLNIPTIIGLFLIPVVAVLRVTLPSPSLGYGKTDITTNSLLLLFFGIYCFWVSALNLIQVNRLWKVGDPGWKRTMAIVYFQVLLFAVSLALLLQFDRQNHFLPGDDRPYGFFIDLFIGLTFLSPAFLCPIGLVLLILGFNTLLNRHNRSKSYVILTFLFSVLFTFGGILPLLITLEYWVSGGFSM